MAAATRDGWLVSTAGLRPTSEGVRLRQRNGKLSQTDGPFTETKEVIGGYAILEAKSMKEAIELTKRFLGVHGDEWDVGARCGSWMGLISAGSLRARREAVSLRAHRRLVPDGSTISAIDAN
jgi:hypothetical protein